jgi:hypothetical protein
MMRKKPYPKMNSKELAKATAEFDRHEIPAGFETLDALGRALWERVKRKRRRSAGTAASRTPQARRAGRK